MKKFSFLIILLSFVWVSFWQTFLCSSWSQNIFIETWVNMIQSGDYYIFPNINTLHTPDIDYQFSWDVWLFGTGWFNIYGSWNWYKARSIEQFAENTGSIVRYLWFVWQYVDGSGNTLIYTWKNFNLTWNLVLLVQSWALQISPWVAPYVPNSYLTWEYTGQILVEPQDNPFSNFVSILLNLLYSNTRTFISIVVLLVALFFFIRILFPHKRKYPF